MAKGSAMGLWKGKKGSSVFYKIWNSNNKEKQGIREYAPEISNPQTNAQTDQRMRMLPAQLVKGALRDIVSRSFQGVEYGSKSRLEFLKYALRAEIFPYLPKGWTDPLPGSYLISRGTLPAINCTFDQSEPGFITDLQYADHSVVQRETTTVGEFAQTLLTYNPALQEGDQLTFVWCEYNSGQLMTCKWYTFSVILDTTSAEILLKQNDYIGLFITDRRLYVGGSGDNAVACSVILSRLGSDGLYMRSTSELSLARDWNPEFSNYYTADAKGEARASYQKKTTRGEYDWPVEDGESTRGGTGTEDGTYTLVGLTGNLATLNGQQVKVRVETGTDEITAVYVKRVAEIDYLIDPAGNELTYFEEGTGTSLRKEQVTALANYPAIVYTNRLTRAAMEAIPAAAVEPEAETKKARSKK